MIYWTDSEDVLVDFARLCEQYPNEPRATLWAEAGGQERDKPAGWDGDPLCPVCGYETDAGHCVVCEPRDEAERKAAASLKLGQREACAQTWQALGEAHDRVVEVAHGQTPRRLAESDH